MREKVGDSEKAQVLVTQEAAMTPGADREGRLWRPGSSEEAQLPVSSAKGDTVWLMLREWGGGGRTCQAGAGPLRGCSRLRLSKEAGGWTQRAPKGLELC